MIIDLKKADYHNKRLGSDFKFGDKVKERDLEPLRIEEFEKRFNRLFYHVISLRAITVNDSNRICDEMFKALVQGKKKITKLSTKTGAKNEHLETVVQKIFKIVDDSLYVLEKEIELKDNVLNQELQVFSTDVKEFVASKIHATRDITIFQNQMGDGHDLLMFKDKIQSSQNIIAYGTDEDVDICREARKNGVDFVAKQGISQMTPHNTFDITLLFMNQFHFDKESSFSYKLPEERIFEYPFKRGVPKKNGLVIFNLPYYKLESFYGKIRRDMSIIDMYRVDDDMQNILFIAEYRKDNVKNDTRFLKAIIGYSKLPHYTEMKDIFINRGELEQLKIFRPMFVDQEDIIQAFDGIETTLELVESIYQPKEKVVELNRPLQEYKEGHRATRFCA